MLHRPLKAKYDTETGLSNLVFARDKQCEEEAKKKGRECRICKLIKEIDIQSGQGTVDVPHYIRGSVTWPIGLNPGYALVSAQDVRSPLKTIRIYEEYPFWSVGTLKGESGIWSFLEKSLKKYHCQYYFYVKSPEHRRYFIQVQRESLIKSKPYLIEAKLVAESEEDVDNLIREYHKYKKFEIEDDFKWFPSIEEEWRNDSFSLLEGNLAKQYKKYREGHIRKEDIDVLPGMKALRALIAGYERVPYRL